MSERKKIAENVWLQYYNDFLYNAGLISEDERNKMKHQINRLTK